MAAKYLILVVEENASCLGFYDPDTGEEVGRVKLSLWPHEIAVASDGHAYVSNFGVRDYDLSLGRAGNSVSVIDVPSRCEIGRYITQTKDAKYWGPHGVKLSPDEAHLYVNVERVMGVRDPDLTRPGSESTKLLKFERSTGQLVRELLIVQPEMASTARKSSRFEDASAAYDVAPGTHNFVFSPDVSDELWMFSGRTGITVIDADNGDVRARMPNFNGAVRALSFGSSGRLLVSATNEVSIVDPGTRTVIKRFDNLGVSQILYSKFTPDEAHILAPAVWEGQVLVIEVATGQVVHRLLTGVDPVQIMIAPDNTRAYVTHGRSEWLSCIDLKDLSVVASRIKTKGGPNGVAFAPWSPAPPRHRVVLAACLPFTGRYAAEGREIRLGYQFWQDTVNDSGGLKIAGMPHEVEIIYADTASALDEVSVRRAADGLLAEADVLAMLGSYPASADRWVGIAAAKVAVPFVSGLGDDARLYDGKNRYAFTLAAESACALESVLQALRHGVSPKPVTMCILAADESQHLEEGRATARCALRLGFTRVTLDGQHDEPVLYVSGRDPVEVLRAVRDPAPDVLLVIGDRDDSIAVVRACAALQFTPGAIALSCGITAPGFKDRMGALADGLLGSVQWTESVFNYSQDRFGAGVDYATVYFEEFSEPASAFAASGSAIGVVLEHVIHAGANSRDAIAQALRSLKLDTFFGPVGFGLSGRNVRKEGYAVQLIKHGEKLREVPLWPRAVAQGRPRWPRG